LSFYFSNPVKFQYSLSVDDFSEIIAGIRAIVIGLGGWQRRLAAAGFLTALTALTALTRLTVLTADRIDIVDLIDSEGSGTVAWE